MRQLALLIGLTPILAVSTTRAQEPAGAGPRPEVMPVPRAIGDLLPVGEDIEAPIARLREENWWKVDLANAEPSKSLEVTLTFDPKDGDDLDIAIVTLAGDVLADSTGTGPTERCAAPIEGLKEAAVLVSRYNLTRAVDAPIGQQPPVGLRFTLRAELTTKRAVRGLPLFLEDLVALPGGRAEFNEVGRLPSRIQPGSWAGYVLDTASTDANVARVVLRHEVMENADLDLYIYGEDGEQLASSVSASGSERCLVPLRGRGRLFVCVKEEAEGEPQPITYDLAISLVREAVPGPQVLEIVRSRPTKRFAPGERVLGQITQAGGGYYAWLYLRTRQQPTVFLNPSDPEARVKLVTRDQDGWTVSESSGEPGLQVAASETDARGLLLVEATADRPCGFALCASQAMAPVSFDPASAPPDPLSPGRSVEGTIDGGPDGSAVAFRLVAPLTAGLPRVVLTADPVYADLDLYVCPTPATVVAASVNPGGCEAAHVPCPGTAPVYVVVKAPRDTAARFTLSVEEDRTPVEPVKGIEGGRVFSPEGPR
jgi:hypothetical protein